jgi:hypothetical protein
MSLLTPRQTAPLSEEARDSMPDWLKSATEGSSMPPLGATSMDWFTSKDKPADDVSQQFDELASQAADQTQGCLPLLTKTFPLPQVTLRLSPIKILTRSSPWTCPTGFHKLSL